MWLSKLLIFALLVVFGHTGKHKDTNNDSEATPSDLFTANTADLEMYEAILSDLEDDLHCRPGL